MTACFICVLGQLLYRVYLYWVELNIGMQAFHPIFKMRGGEMETILWNVGNLALKSGLGVGGVGQTHFSR